MPAIPNPPRATGALLSGSDAATRTQAIAPLPATGRSSSQTGSAASLPARAGNLPRAGQAVGGSALREPGLQQRLGALQQGQAYLDQLGEALQGLKSGLSQALARPQSAGQAGLQAQLEAVQQLWRARADAAGGALDARLQTPAEGEATRQRFRLRGLDLNTLASDGSETLRLSLPGQPRPVIVALDGRGLQPGLQSLQRALAPTGLRVETGGGELQFSVEESAWPALRDGLGIKGDGKRFPSGQTVRATLDPAADALAPAAWKLDGAEAQRRSLVQVLDAQARLSRARQALDQRLGAAETLGRDDGGDAAALHRFAAEFARAPTAVPLDYARLSALAPAVQGLHRGQVQQLLLPRGSEFL